MRLSLPFARKLVWRNYHAKQIGSHTRCKSHQSYDPIDDFAKRLSDHFGKVSCFYQSLNILLCKVIRNAFTITNDSALLSVSARLTKHLLSLAEGYGEPHEKGIQLSLYLTQDDLATIINTTR